MSKHIKYPRRSIAVNPKESPDLFIEKMLKLKSEKGIQAVVDAKKGLGRFRGEHLSAWNNSDIGKETAREANRATTASHRRKYPEHNKELARERYNKNKDEMKSYQKKYRDANKEKISEQRRINRIKRLKGGGSSTGGGFISNPLLPIPKKTK